MPLLGLSLGPNVGWAAVGLNSLDINISRSIGPDAGGLLFASVGAAVTDGMGLIRSVVVITALVVPCCHW